LFLKHILLPPLLFLSKINRKIELNKLLLKFRSLPELVRMMCIAIVGVGIGFVTYELIYYLNPIKPKASSSWFMAFMIGIARQHGLHRWFTFADKSPYLKSLFRAYIMYSSALILSSGLNWVLTETLHFNHRIAWLICVGISGLISLIFLRTFVFKFRDRDN